MNSRTRTAILLEQRRHEIENDCRKKYCVLQARHQKCIAIKQMNIATYKRP